MTKPKKKVRLRALETRALAVRKNKPYIAGNPSRDVKPSPVRSLWFLASIKMGNKHVKVEAESEFVKARELETDNSVVEYQHQPKPISYQLAGEESSRSYTPDFLVTYRDGSKEYFECKTREFAYTAENERLYAAVRASLAPTGIPLTIAILEEMQAGYRERNADILLHCRMLEPDPAVVQLVRDIFRFNPPQTLGQLVRSLDREMLMNGMEFRAPVLHGTRLTWGVPDPTINHLKGMALRNVFCIDLESEVISEFSAVSPEIPTPKS